jgi:hypothetical protein
LGINGEPKKDVEVNLKLKTQFLSPEETLNFKLYTNEQGLINLGKLEGIEKIEASSNQIEQIVEWTINEQIKNYTYPRYITATESE